MINGPSNESEVFDSPKRSCSSTIIVENRKRSLAQSSDDEVSSNIVKIKIKKIPKNKKIKKNFYSL